MLGGGEVGGGGEGGGGDVGVGKVGGTRWDEEGRRRRGGGGGIRMNYGAFPWGERCYSIATTPSPCAAKLGAPLAPDACP